MRVVVADSSDRLPFTCPFQIPENLPQPGETNGGLAPNLNLAQASSGLYAEYRAAQALVPCDAEPIQIFIENDIGKVFSVSVIYVFDGPVEQLKKWLE